jgi:hypothetical protein
VLTLPEAANPLQFAFALAPISFTVPLTAPLTKVHLIAKGASGTGTGTCPTTSSLSKPEAEPGNLCIFEGTDANVNEIEIVNPMDEEENEAGTTGVILHVHPVETSKTVVAQGTWAVTAE